MYERILHTKQAEERNVGKLQNKTYRNINLILVASSNLYAILSAVFAASLPHIVIELSDDLSATRALPRHHKYRAGVEAPS